MPRDVLASMLLLAVDNAPSPDSSTAITLAIIGGLVTVLVALIGLVGTRLAARKAEPAPVPHDDDEVTHEAAMERFLLRLGFDPDKIKSGKEWPNDVKFF